MKKTYMIPETQVLKIETTPLMTFSDQNTGAKFDPNATSGTMDSRGSSLWDDDED